MGLNREVIEEHLKYLKEDKYDIEFYVALLLYDIRGIDDIKDLTDEDIDIAYDIQDDYDSIYNEDMRDRFLYDFKRETEEEKLEKDVNSIRSLLTMFNDRSVYEIETAMLINEFMDCEMKNVTDTDIKRIYELVKSHDEIVSNSVKEEMQHEAEEQEKKNELQEEEMEI